MINPARRWPIRVTAIAVCAPCLVAAPVVQTPSPSLADLLHRLTAYVSAYGHEASAFVAREEYTQEVAGSRQPGAPVGRSTIAEFAIVKTSGSQPWVGFRDITDVDGRPITDHRDRLLAILTAPAGDADQARQLSEESARFNIGPVERNFNVPTTVLFFFTPENLDRFTFKIGRQEKPDLFRIDFHEKHAPTLIRTPGGASVYSGGELLVDAGGVVHETILRMQPYSDKIGSPIATTIDVRYARPPGMEVWLPSLMTEEYVLTRVPNGAHILTRAEYSNYRQFETSATIKSMKIKDPRPRADRQRPHRTR